MQFREPSHEALACAHLGFTWALASDIAALPFEAARTALAQLKTDMKRRFKAFSLEHHPDRTGGDKAKEELFKVVSGLYQALETIEIRPRPQPRPIAYYVVVQYSSTPTTTPSGFPGFGGINVTFR